MLAVAVYTPTGQPTDPVTSDVLFTASATIMGLAAFGSALSTLGHNMISIKSIAYTLVPLIGVQATFMASLLGHVGIPAWLWIIMTPIFLFLLVLAIVANRVKTSGADGSTQ